MSPLHLPKNAASILQRACRGDASLTDNDNDKWLIYIIDNALADASEFAYLAMDYWQTVESPKEMSSASRNQQFRQESISAPKLLWTIICTCANGD